MTIKLKLHLQFFKIDRNLMSRIKLRFATCTVQRVKKRWEVDRSINRRQGSERPPISTSQQDEALLDYLRENPFDIAKQPAFATHFPGSYDNL
jgi:hypothetical protein